MKKSWTAIEIALSDKKIFMSQSRAWIRKLAVHDHMTHVVKVDILTGYEEKGDLPFILKTIFHCIFIEKQSIFSILVQLFM